MSLPFGAVFDGDSLTAGGSVQPPYPSRFKLDTGRRISNIGVSGRQLQEMDDEYATATAPEFSARMNRLVILGGINDIRSHAADDADLGGWIRSYCGKAQATGFQVYVGTLMPCSSSWDGTKEGYRTAYNTDLRANWGDFADGLIDFDDDPSLDDSTDTTYFSDGLHPTRQGNEVMASLVRVALGVDLLTGDNAVLLHKDASQAVSAATTTALSWQWAARDDLGLYDAGAPTLLTIPVGLNGRYGRLAACQRYTSGGQLVASFLKNGAAFHGSVAFADSQTVGDTAVNVKTPPVLLATDDEFLVRTFAGGASTVPADEWNWLAFELLPADFNGALVGRSSTQAISANTPAMIGWNAETYDLDSWHDTATDNTRLTVPSGVERVRVSAGIVQPSSTAVLTVEIYKNGATFRGMGAANTATDGSDGVQVVTGVIEVVPGDYFEVRVTSTAGVTLAADSQWASIEAVPADRPCAMLYRSTNQVIPSLTVEPVEFDTAVYDDGFFDGGSPGVMTVPAGVNRVRVSANLTAGDANFNVAVRVNGLPWYASASHDTTGGTEAVNVLGPIITVAPGDEISVTTFDNSGTTLGSAAGTWCCIEAFDAIDVPDVTNVVISPPNSGGAPGGSAQLTAVVLDGNGDPMVAETVTWDSSDDAVATVDAAGLVTFVAVGSCVVTATSDTDAGVSGTCAVLVTVTGRFEGQLWPR